MNLDSLKNKFNESLKKVADAKSLEELRVKFLGRKSELTEVFRSLKDLPVAKRRELGPKANSLRKEFEESIQDKLSKLQTTNYKLPTRIDLTLPGKKSELGHLHPLTKIEKEVKDIFRGMNFSVIEGPEVESEYYNFDVLNIPAGHPARDMWDTFWLSDNQNVKLKIKNQKLKIAEKLLLRTHTSPMQVRYMETHKPPFQIIVPGRCFRYEATDASHEINFYQVEGLMVGENISLANFKFIIEEFFKRLFKEQKIEFRFRPSYFPFVEPGLEIDIKIVNPRRQGVGAPTGASEWLEVMGAGMVHPHVFEYAHYNPNDLQGFAFGVGLDRLAMIKYKVPDIRLFYSGDLRFIKQF